MVFGVPQIPGVDCFELVIFLVENAAYIVAANIVALTMVKSGAVRWIVGLVIPVTVCALIAAVVLGSFEDARLKSYDLTKPSLREALEAYIETGDGHLSDIVESNRYAPTVGRIELRYLLQDLLVHTFFHLDVHNSENVPVAYNKGNDWFAATLGKAMVYTSAIFPHGNESLWDGQHNKLDYVAHSVELKKGAKVMDIGCGWGRLAQYLADHYGAEVTGVTLSSEQLTFAKELNKNNGAKFLLQDAMKLREAQGLPQEGFDAITALEMAEHVGVKRYQEFLSIVHSLLKEDGKFYLQVAGLRRQWQYEDLVWGLFMGEHVFPGADASCPLGWVVTQLERAGFEVQRVNNLGTHYSKTLWYWLEEWRANQKSIASKYGEKMWRRWEVFLAWSVRIARQGSSTVFMITATKQGQEAARIRSQAHLVP